MHVTIRVNVDDKGDAGDDHHHDQGKRVNQKGDVGLKFAGEDPGVKDLFNRPLGRRQLEQGVEYQEGNQKREPDGSAGDKTHHSLGHSPPEKQIDGKTNGREQRYQTYIIQHSYLLTRYWLPVARCWLSLLVSGFLNEEPGTSHEEPDLPFHQIHLIGIHGLLGAVHGHDDGQAHGRLGRSHGYDKDHNNLAVHGV